MLKKSPILFVIFLIITFSSIFIVKQFYQKFNINEGAFLASLIITIFYVHKYKEIIPKELCLKLAIFYLPVHISLAYISIFYSSSFKALENFKPYLFIIEIFGAIFTSFGIYIITRRSSDYLLKMVLNKDIYKKGNATKLKKQSKIATIGFTVFCLITIISCKFPIFNNYPILAPIFFISFLAFIFHSNKRLIRTWNEEIANNTRVNNQKEILSDKEEGSET